MGSPAVLILTAKVRAGEEGAFFAWQSEHGRAVGARPGLVGSDIIPPADPAGRAWTLILNFRTPEDLRAWRESPVRAASLERARPFLEGGGFEETVSQEGFGENPGSNVTEVIFTKVKPGKDEAYRAWAARIQAVQARFPGYRGTYLQPPSSGDLRLWTTLLRYDTTGQLEAWMASPERAKLLEESKAFIEDAEFLRLATAFPGWVPVHPKDGQAAPDWKVAVLVLLGLYPIVMLEVRFLNPSLAAFGLGQAGAVFLANTLGVALTSFLAMPLLIRAFGWWVFPEQGASPALTLRGAALLAGLLALEIALFSRF